MIAGVFAIGWAVASLLELFEVVEPLDGATHAVSFVLMLVVAQLQMVLFVLERMR